MTLSRGTPTHPSLLLAHVLLPVDTTGAVCVGVCVCMGGAGESVRLCMCVCEAGREGGREGGGRKGGGRKGGRSKEGR